MLFFPYFPPFFHHPLENYYNPVWGFIGSQPCKEPVKPVAERCVLHYTVKVINIWGGKGCRALVSNVFVCFNRVELHGKSLVRWHKGRRSSWVKSLFGVLSRLF